ncbi:hypothetical protein QJS04_geneDACA001782 [Acorus gramineus]|uniref:Large ribosomal subunit protein uL2 C-terminal domain-containing protein n=1 Tax=Acorus gramineus TaxID=55184 RepID=A0AAV9BHK2_ACOGR|nr:hypothetical protein QJS04_geneDACA001782 [Acorus gramineus]
MPLGTAIHNIEITLGKGGQLARAAGAVAKLIAKEGKSATLRLPSGEVRLISKNCSATVGQVGNVGANQQSLGRAGSKCWLGKRPVVRGVVMNPVDHPHGGGEGRAPIVSGLAFSSVDTNHIYVQGVDYEVFCGRWKESQKVFSFRGDSNWLGFSKSINALKPGLTMEKYEDKEIDG